MHAEILNYEPESIAAHPGEKESFLALQDLIKAELTPKVVDIDLKGEYPENFLRKMGEIGGFAGAVAPEYGGSGGGWNVSSR